MQKSSTHSLAEPPMLAVYCLLLTASLLTLGIYATHVGDFFILDSVDALGTNVRLQFDPASFDQWRIAAISSDRGLFGRPLSSLTFAIDVQLAGGADAGWMKGVNVLLHVLTGLVAWRVFSLALTGSPVLGMDSRRARWIAIIAVSAWMLHPLHVSTVLYTVQRMAQLSTLFILAGLWCFTKRRVSWMERAPTATDISSLLLGVCVFTLLATLCKGNGVLLPLFAATLELALFRGRVAGGVALLPLRVSQLALLLPVLVMLLLLAAQPAWLVEMYAGRDFTLSERILTQLRVLWQYLGWIALWDLSSLGVFHDDVPVSTSLWQPLSTLVSLIAWLGIIALAWVLRSRLPVLALALLWFLVGHSMESTLIPLELMFEHRNYLASMGPFLLFAWALTSVPTARLGLAAAGATATMVLLGWLLFTTTAYWSDELTLAEVQYQHHPESLRSRLHLANVHVEQMAGKTDQRVVQRHFRAARELHWRIIQQNRNYVPSLFSLIYLESLARRPEEVQRLYEQLRLALDKPGVTPTEVSGLQSLATCLGGGICITPSAGTREYLEQLLDQRDLMITRELLMRHCLAIRDAECVEVHAEAVLAMSPEQVYPYLALYSASVAQGDLDGAQTVAQRMLKADKNRIQLHGVRDAAAAGR